MADKKWYKLIYKQVQPIHIGKGRFGVLGETRIFIPGWTMWGALTVAYNKREGFKLDNNQNFFEEISNFFPALDEEGNNILLPDLKKGEFHLDQFSEREFRAKFCDVLMSTAVKPISRQSMDASLHELEFILPAMKADVKQHNESVVKHLFWVGYIRVEENFNEFPKQIFIGGDRRYGYGLLKFVDKKEANTQEAENPKLWFVDYQLAADDIEAHSQLELLPEFDFLGIKDKGYKINLKNTKYFYSPGHNLNENMKFYKGKIVKTD